jgi:hypothetical protein
LILEFELEPRHLLWIGGSTRFHIIFDFFRVIYVHSLLFSNVDKYELLKKLSNNQFEFHHNCNCHWIMVHFFAGKIGTLLIRQGYTTIELEHLKKVIRVGTKPSLRVAFQPGGFARWWLTLTWVRSTFTKVQTLFREHKRFKSETKWFINSELTL